MQWLLVEVAPTVHVPLLAASSPSLPLVLPTRADLESASASSSAMQMQSLRSLLRSTQERTTVIVLMRECQLQRS